MIDDITRFQSIVRGYRYVNLMTSPSKLEELIENRDIEGLERHLSQSLLALSALTFSIVEYYHQHDEEEEVANEREHKSSQGA